ncbi:hypothetical protein Taro_018708 [Colocasia esculenta]|uniref:Uncharacterized protein n=1 Tax=Colocasia esculenta TaxID=4460 RepID=A0A843URQ2_COLES|nr:hypothetical protein [Colocasia esculenta]
MTNNSKEQGRITTTSQVVSTLVQVVSTQCFKYKAKRSSSVDTSSSSVDTRDGFQKTFWPIWDSVLTLDQVVSTLDQLPETFWVKLGQCVDTRSGSVDTRDLPRTPSGLFWDSVSTLDQISDKTHLYNVGYKIQDSKTFPWRVLKDKRLTIRSFLGDQSNKSFKQCIKDQKAQFQVTEEVDVKGCCRLLSTVASLAVNSRT